MITAMPRIAIASNDFEGMLRTFRDDFGLPVVDISAASVGSLGAKLGMCVPDGGSNIELMSPAVPEAPLSQSLTRFLDRRGDGLFALMLEAPDPDAEAELLLERGLQVLPLMAGAGGRDVHPRSTHGVLIRVYPNDSFQAPADQIQRSGERALGLSGITRVMIAVRDLDQAMQVYGAGLGLEIGAAGTDPTQGVRRCLFRPPRGGVIELLAVADGTRPFAAAIDAQLHGKGEGLFALVLGADDPQAAAAALAQRGVAVAGGEGWPGDAVIDSAHGVRILIEGRRAAP